MKRIACAAVTLMVLFSGQSYAELVNHPAPQSSRATMILPTAQQASPFDFNHMGVGSDKSDSLGVPYYHQRS
ncbi:multiple antibiotic resistance protein MarB [Enterobacter sp. Bisph1]|uniref:multiple antibiotic resistance protein MarB n=1 Tax=Enterobacter sp. Bisph1 TaxID=1274399 RepID=UPI00057C16C9|nr:multiple antibiotic resistance protein MarB [Enterobacter sp. Bisph1]